MTLVQDHDLEAGMLVITNATDTGHIVHEDGEAVCGAIDIDMDRVTENDGRITYGPGPYSDWHRGILHEDGRSWTTGTSLCKDCDSTIPDELQEQLFTGEKFDRVEGLSVGGDENGNVT